MKLLLIFIDGLEPKYLIQWRDLHYFHRMMREGSFGYLMSTLPPYSIPACLSLITGKNPGRLGVYSFQKRRTGSYYHSQSPINVGKDFFVFLSDANFRVGVVNIPFTHPAKKVKGIMITAADVNNPAAYYPSELRYEVDKRYGKRKIWYRWSFRGINDKGLLRDWEEIVLNQIRLYTHLLDGDFDFFACGFNVDILQHYIHDAETIHDAYLFLESVVKILVKKAKPDNLFIISDHGGDISKGNFHINTFLQTRGFLSLVKGAKPSFRVRARKLVGRVRGARWAAAQLERTLFYKLISKFFSPMSSFNEMVCKIDWSRTLAYSPSLNCIFLNLKGREPNGIVLESEYEQTCERIAQELSNVVDNRNGRKIDVRVFFKNEIYEGQHLSEMPDLVIDIPYYICSVLLADQLVSDPTPLSVCHSLFGAILAVGKDIGEGVHLSNAKITSIAPTILHLYGVPIPEYMDGVLLDLFRPGSDPYVREPHIVRAQTELDSEGRDLSREEEETIVNRLRRLGYL